MMIGVGMAIAFKMMEDTQIMRDLNKMMRKRMRMIKNMF
jgi:predicted small secreted protein